MRVGSVPGIPLIYLNKVTLVLEPPSQDSRDYGNEVKLAILKVRLIIHATLVLFTISPRHPLMYGDKQIMMTFYYHDFHRLSPPKLS